MEEAAMGILGTLVGTLGPTGTLIGMGVMAAHTLASVVVKVTPSKSDDALFEKFDRSLIWRIIEKVALNRR